MGATSSMRGAQGPHVAASAREPLVDPLRAAALASAARSSESSTSGPVPARLRAFRASKDEGDVQAKTEIELPAHQAGASHEAAKIRQEVVQMAEEKAIIAELEERKRRRV